MVETNVTVMSQLQEMLKIIYLMNIWHILKVQAMHVMGKKGQILVLSVVLMVFQITWQIGNKLLRE